jgi:bifunctional non-homologous end joining protein LigD
VHGNARLWSRNAIEWSKKVPELVSAIEALELDSAQLDGEMIVLRNGRDDFNALQGRLSAENKAPPIYMLFDVPNLNGRSLRKVALIERKAVLADLLARHAHPLLRFSEHSVGNGEQAFAQATKAGLEGIVCKRIDSHYAGARNGDWVKVKGRPSDEFVVIGFTEPKGTRSGIGALLLAQPRKGKLTYVGRVGTGLRSEQLRTLRRELQQQVIDHPAADIELMARRDQALAIWVKPRVVVEAFYQGVGSQGLLRQPAFKAIREDKTPRDLGVQGRGKRVAHAAARSAPTKRSSKPTAAQSADGVAITHPDRVVFPGLDSTKADVADYYRAVARWILPDIADRPLSILRCPAGAAKACFFQKHLSGNMGRHVRGVNIRDSTGRQKYLCIADAAGLIELVQMNALEFHPWGARADDPEHADRIVFDLDPHPGVAWRRVIAGACAVRDRLKSIGLKSFVRTSGGKGLHVVVPLNPAAPWDTVRHFAGALAQTLASELPKEFVATAGEKNRKGRIFVDWLRNGRGATSVASYSLRARPDGGVAMPLTWTQLATLRAANQFTLINAARHIGRRRVDPWQGIDEIEQTLPAKSSAR